VLHYGGRREPILFSSNLKLPDFRCRGTQKVCSFVDSVGILKQGITPTVETTTCDVDRDRILPNVCRTVTGGIRGILLTQILSMCRCVLSIHSVMHQIYEIVTLLDTEGVVCRT